MKIVVAITGASGSIYAADFIEKIKNRIHLFKQVDMVISDSGKQVWQHEIGTNPIDSITFKIWDNKNFLAPFASGSALYNAMIIIPCSMGSIARIASGISNDLITRAADVFLKERRKLILVTRETPLHLIHLENMLKITQAGGIICPASPSFYKNPQSINDLIATITNRVFDLLQVENNYQRWGS
ncbi:MAG: UbiX family flavin prenyltransferase [Sediminibacterium sp.]|nr:UbiX family flavin prenyltransferase [Sediminibacterium sp.]